MYQQWQIDKKLLIVLVIINLGRGALIDETALVSALQNRQLRGMCIAICQRSRLRLGVVSLSIQAFGTFQNHPFTDRLAPTSYLKHICCCLYSISSMLLLTQGLQLSDVGLGLELENQMWVFCTCVGTHPHIYIYICGCVTFCHDNRSFIGCF